MARGKAQQRTGRLQEGKRAEDKKMSLKSRTTGEGGDRIFAFPVSPFASSRFYAVLRVDMDPTRLWKLRLACPIVLLAANAFGIAFTPALIHRCALAAFYILALVYSATALAIMRAADTTEIVVHGKPERVREHDLRSLRETAHSSAVALVAAYCLYLAGVTTNLLLVQTLLLPLTALTSAVVQSALFGEAVVRPFPSETEVLSAAWKRVSADAKKKER